jgi:hypothetical protein
MNRLHRVQRIRENSRAVEAHLIKALQKSLLGICTERSGRRQRNTLRSKIIAISPARKPLRTAFRADRGRLNQNPLYSDFYHHSFHTETFL